MKKEINQKRWNLNVLLTCIFLVLITSSLHASNYITVATIGAHVPELDRTQGMQKMVEQVIGFWRGEFKQVLPDKPDLIVLPEYCDLPGGLSREEKIEYFRIRKSQVQDFFASVAKANHCYIAFGSPCDIKDGSWHNSCVMVDRKGNIAGIYNNNYPTPDEMKGGVKADTNSPLIQCDFGTVACVLCFDLNFDELRLAYAALKPSIIVFPAMYHGGLVQAYWAYTCRSFLIGSLAFKSIPSEIRNPLGEVVASNTNYFDYAVSKINLDTRLVHIDYNNEKLFNLKKKYGDGVKITDPNGQLDAILVESRDPKVTVVQMLNEFKIELIDDYFDRSRKFRLEPENIRDN